MIQTLELRWMVTGVWNVPVLEKSMVIPGKVQIGITLRYIGTSVCLLSKSKAPYWRDSYASIFHLVSIQIAKTLKQTKVCLQGNGWSNYSMQWHISQPYNEGKCGICHNLSGPMLSEISQRWCLVVCLLLTNTPFMCCKLSAQFSHVGRSGLMEHFGILKSLLWMDECSNKNIFGNNFPPPPPHMSCDKQHLSYLEDTIFKAPFWKRWWALSDKTVNTLSLYLPISTTSRTYFHCLWVFWYQMICYISKKWSKMASY